MTPAAAPARPRRQERPVACCPHCGWAPASFGVRLQALREARGLTRAAAAQRCGVSVALWSMWEYDERRPSTATFAALCAALELNVAECAELATATGPRQRRA